MNFKELKSFVTISKYKNFSKAAQALYLTQPTISNHIQSLEEELQTTLLIRNSKSVSLTKSGKMLLVHAQKILNEKEQIHFMFDQYNDDISGELEIATSTIPGQYYLPKIIRSFSLKHPQMKFKVEKLDSAEVHRKLAFSEINFGIVGSKSNNESFEYEKILSDTIVLCCDAKLDIPDKITIDQIKTLPLIIREEGSGTRKHLINHLKSHGILFNELNVFSTIDDTNTIKACILNSNKFTFTSQIAVADELERGNLKIVEIEDFVIERDFYFVSNLKHTLTPLSQAFKKFITENA